MHFLQCILAVYELILVKFYGRVESGPRTNSSDFGGDPDAVKDVDPWFGSVAPESGSTIFRLIFGQFFVSPTHVQE